MCSGPHGIHQPSGDGRPRGLRLQYIFEVSGGAPGGGANQRSRGEVAFTQDFQKPQKRRTLVTKIKYDLELASTDQMYVAIHKSLGRKRGGRSIDSVHSQRGAEGIETKTAANYSFLPLSRIMNPYKLRLLMVHADDSLFPNINISVISVSPEHEPNQYFSSILFYSILSRTSRGATRHVCEYYHRPLTSMAGAVPMWNRQRRSTSAAAFQPTCGRSIDRSSDAAQKK